MMKGKLHIGISGWSYRDWIGVFYPENLKATGWLPYYAGKFDCTEINSSFYRLPSKLTVSNWVNRVPDNFLFCPKMSRYLTHIKRLKEPEEPLERFFTTFEPMKKKMGPVLLQLAKTIPFEYKATEHLFKLLATKYSSHQFAMEVRHESWLTEQSYSLMSNYGIAFVMSHSGDHFPYKEVITAPHIYFRFHGPGSLYNTKYDERALKEYSLKFENWLDKGHDLWVFFNNCWFGYGIDNACSLRNFLQEFIQPAPAG